jgi:hypothetical protein
MKRLKNAAKKIPFLKSIYQRIRPANKASISNWINKYISNDAIQILQIGSNDGVSGDPLYNSIQKNQLWNVLFVEPVPQIFNLLKKNYGSSPRFRFENSGINESGINQTFYVIGEEAYQSILGFSQDYKQIGSFSKAQVQELSTNELQQFIDCRNLSCNSL